ncbi:hypothetical protein S40293_10536 [Stachybotrys chartarum IBT 40293]|nr:hypothetical protein S40293_10536 [Stachybotrys chartarum IBT 40293]
MDCVQALIVCLSGSIEEPVSFGKRSTGGVIVTQPTPRTHALTLGEKDHLSASGGSIAPYSDEPAAKSTKVLQKADEGGKEPDGQLHDTAIVDQEIGKSGQGFQKHVGKTFGRPARPAQQTRVVCHGGPSRVFYSDRRGNLLHTRYVASSGPTPVPGRYRVGYEGSPICMPRSSSYEEEEESEEEDSE